MHGKIQEYFVYLQQQKIQSHLYTNLYTLTRMCTHTYTQTEGIMQMRNLHLNFTKERQR